MRIIVVPGTSEAGLEVRASLRFTRGAILISGSTDPEYAREIGYGTSVFLPSAYSSEFKDALQSACFEHDVDAVIPGHDHVAYVLRGCRTIGPARIVSHSEDFLETVRSKRRTYDRLKDVTETPEVFSFSGLDRHDFPIFAKPDQGQGSRDAVLVQSHAQLRALQGRTSLHPTSEPDFLLCEYIDGPEISVDCFSDLSGNLLFAGARERGVIRAGISVHTWPTLQPGVQERVKRISDALRPNGAWFVQFKLRDDVPVLLEVGPRIAGSSGMWRLNGVNLAEMALHQALGRQVVAPTVNSMVGSVRQLGIAPAGLQVPPEICFDFDDVIAVPAGINGYALALAAAARSCGIRTIVVSRHAGNLLNRLKDAHASDLFDGITHIRDGSAKSAYISPGAWYFDDSFAERQAVLQDRPDVLALDASAIPAMIPLVCDMALRRSL